MNLIKHKKEINQKGFTIVKKAFPKKIIKRLLLDLNKYEKTKMRSTTGKKIIDSKLILNPHNNSKNFCRILFSNLVEKFCISFLNDPYYRSIPKKMPNYCLNHSIARSSGKDFLTYHRDDRNPPSTSKEVCYLQFGLAIDEVDRNNGCTTCIPKSHLTNSYVKNIKKYKPFYFVLKPGDLIVYDGRLWHSAQKNSSDRSRWMFFFGFARWHLRQTYDFTRNININILKNLNLKEKLKLGYHAITKISEEANNGAGQRGNLKYAQLQHKLILKKMKKNKLHY